MFTRLVRPVRSLHTSATLSSDTGFFGKLNPWATKEKVPEVTPAQTTAVTFDVKFEEEKPVISSWKNETVIGDPQEIASTVQSIVLSHTTTEDWQHYAFPTLDMKFKVLKETMRQLGRDIPDHQLNSMDTIQDVLRFYQSSPPAPTTVSSFFEHHAVPSNMTFVH
ncbi:hypothetical protein BDB01DRAFT_806348 [Pilobolus umbonatus]|nr:hypothetical protein BDB01DRAFT_806348 [Pilobolus umbonatus]